MSMLIDKQLTTGLMKIAGAILKEHFFYDIDGVTTFYTLFAEHVNAEHLQLCTTAPQDFKEILEKDPNAKTHFTATFCNYHILKALYSLEFSDQELDLFNMLINKYVKVVE